MRRRQFITLLGGAAAVWPLAARAQRPGKLPLIGVLVSASPPHPFADAFWRGLHALGYSEGENIRVEFRYTNGQSDRAEEYAEEFVRLGVDIIVAHFVPAVEAAMGGNANDPDCHGAAWRALTIGRCQQLSSARRKRHGPISNGCGDWRQTAAAPPRTHSEPWLRRSSSHDRNDSAV